MKDFRRDLLEEFIVKDERLRNLYNQIENHPEHKRKLTVEESFSRTKGRISYGRNEVSIEMDITLGSESILILAHELMHYLLILNGALLPIEMNDNPPSDASSLKHFLMKSITHHFLLKRELDYAGFGELQLCFALSNELQEIPYDYFHDDKFWLLELYDRSTFAQNYNFVALREKFELHGLISIYNLLQSSPKDSISDINELSRILINEFNCENYLQLMNLDDYTSS
ncbi:hypothetical protein [Cytobacillus sp. BC1816]|uniref:hypothetical protein n=1 Tax=Cytobacillus sp. BC1816 TaxID=3440154 RepID=UPI003F514A87